MLKGRRHLPRGGAAEVSGGGGARAGGRAAAGRGGGPHRHRAPGGALRPGRHGRSHAGVPRPPCPDVDQHSSPPACHALPELGPDDACREAPSCSGQPADCCALLPGLDECKFNFITVTDVHCRRGSGVKGGVQGPMFEKEARTLQGKPLSWVQQLLAHGAGPPQVGQPWRARPVAVHDPCSPGCDTVLYGSTPHPQTDRKKWFIGSSLSCLMSGRRCSAGGSSWRRPRENGHCSRSAVKHAAVQPR